MVLYYLLSAVLFKREKNGVFRLKLREDLLVQFLCEQIFLMLHAQSFATDNRVLHLPECTAASVKKTLKKKKEKQTRPLSETPVLYNIPTLVTHFNNSSFFMSFLF